MRFVDSGGSRGPTRLTRRGKHSGSGSARLDLYVGDSQKGPEILAEPTARERLHRSLSRGRKAVHRVTAVTEGKIDRPYPGRAMVSESAEQRVQSSSHGLQYGQDWPCRYFSNDFNKRWRTSHATAYFRCSSLSRHSHGLPIVGARPIGSAIVTSSRHTE